MNIQVDDRAESEGCLKISSKSENTSKEAVIAEQDVGWGGKIFPFGSETSQQQKSAPLSTEDGIIGAHRRYLALGLDEGLWRVMFVLLGVKDTVPVEPKAFDIKPEVAIQDALNKKYANKLIMGKGLALSVFDILTAEDGKVTWGNGLMYYKVSIRLMLFAPFIGEVMVGKVVSTTRLYIRGFFQDIYITPNLLAPNTGYDASQNRFFWYSDPEDDSRAMTNQELANTVVADRLYIDDDEPIRFRISDTEWQAVKPTPEIPSFMQDNEEVDEYGNPIKRKDPIEQAGYKIFASIAESGLGITHWWRDSEDEVAEGEQQAEWDGMDAE